MATKKRRLEDLYVIGKELTFDDGEVGEDGKPVEPVVVWLQKLNPVDMSTAMRRSNAKRAAVMAVRQHPDSDRYQEMWGEVNDLAEGIGDGRQGLIDYLMAEETARAQERAEAQLGAEEEWSKDDYIQGLRDAWTDGLMERHHIEPDEESEQVWKEIQRFAAEATEMANTAIAEKLAEVEARDTDLLKEEVFAKIIDYHGSSEWLEEFHRCELWLGVRDPEDRKQRYFPKREEIDVLAGPILTRLYTEYAELSVDVTEGKGLEETPVLSSSSAPSDEAVEGVSSGLVAVSQ